MTRTLPFFCVILFLSLSTHAQETKPLGSLDLDLDRLKTWGTKVYTYEASRPGSSEKTIMGRTALKTEVTGDFIVLNDRMEIESRGKKLTLDLTHRCKKDKLLMERDVVEASSGGIP